MFKDGEVIRAISLAIIRNERGQLLLAAGYDKVKDLHFYRHLGGGIDFGETSEEALRRELREELGAELINCHLLKVVENIFTFDGARGHEICFIYEADFADQSLYQRDDLKILDSDRDGTVLWLTVNHSNINSVFPVILDLIKD